MKKLVAAMSIVILFLTSMQQISWSADNSLGIAFNNNVVFEEVGVGTHNNVLMVPAIELAQSIGGSFYYDRIAMTGTLKYGENQLVFYLDNDIVSFNGKYIRAEAPMKVINLRYMVPAEFSYRKLGVEVYMHNRVNMLMAFNPSERKLTYNVISGDSLWRISRLFNTTISSIKQLNGLTGDIIYPGQNLKIKEFKSNTKYIEAYTSNSATLSSGTSLNVKAVGYLQPWTRVDIKGKAGDWYKVNTPIGEGYIHKSVTWIRQDINNTSSNSQYFNNVIPVDTSSNYTTYKDYTVKMGDSMWSISQQLGIPNNELESINNLPSGSVLDVGQVLKIPVHHIAKKDTPTTNSGEVLDWFSEGNYVFPIGATGKLIDVETGKSFMIKRTIGANHADCETLTKRDTQTMKEIFGWNWTWSKRPFILETAERRFAVSVSGMPHAGVDGVPFLDNVANRSGGYGYGPNYNKISGNGMDGHFDVYFLNSKRHNNNGIDAAHQQNVLIAGGLR
ncbi:LysM peptidoglycan-binding domain-containing protein [Herbivorax sp. ANBcel31]|uniref:LysM peptidoglycan-binding domain-containing protein n=1 Tax=Herbivorax sp. ANBcel31 TaxID=3069754 RepID=UPI0027B5959F|nr:LysM peptidoglycan-binding domain-containing protein [Herbivorax sp. ANBcel31]MDQ2084900.1 LysM peptidoglycan-binding domain-containing protein [Herbivorax sp. ANBcel31]